MMAKGELLAVAKDVSACTKCSLSKGRTMAVPGVGPDGASIMLLGEAPGRMEDRTGRPFVGPAGRMLDKALSAAGLRIVASGVVSIGLTTALMFAARANHAPACATTLIVSLGVLPGLADGALIMVAVTGMFLTHRLVMLARK